MTAARGRLSAVGRRRRPNNQGQSRAFPHLLPQIYANQLEPVITTKTNTAAPPARTNGVGPVVTRRGSRGTGAGVLSRAFTTTATRSRSVSTLVTSQPALRRQAPLRRRQAWSRSRWDPTGSEVRRTDDAARRPGGGTVGLSQLAGRICTHSARHVVNAGWRPTPFCRASSMQRGGLFSLGIDARRASRHKIRSRRREPSRHERTIFALPRRPAPVGCRPASLARRPVKLPRSVTNNAKPTQIM